MIEFKYKKCYNTKSPISYRKMMKGNMRKSLFDALMWSYRLEDIMCRNKKRKNKGFLHAKPM